MAAVPARGDRAHTSTVGEPGRCGEIFSAGLDRRGSGADAGGDKVASWMRQSGGALRDYVRSASAAPARPSDVMGNAMECPRGDRLAYRIWGIILDSQQAYAQRFAPESSSRADPSNPLDAMSWPDAVKNGGPSFKYKGIDFAMRQGVLHWMTKKGRWVPISARLSGDCQRCAKEGVPSEQVRHWHFQCAQWS